MPLEPIQGKPLRFPPGRVEVRLNEEHRHAYRKLYGAYGTILSGLPVLRPERDFDGRPVRMTGAELEALNREFSRMTDSAPARTAWSAQEQGRTRLFKRLQYLS